MDLPPIDDLAVLDHVIMRMLGRGETRVIREDPNPVSYLESIECIALARLDLSMLLG